MTQRARRTLGSAVLIAAVAVAVVAAFLPLTAERGEPREIGVVIRNMAFYLEGHDEPNPAIHVGRGETIALLVRNDDAGITHDFAVHAWGVSTGRLGGGSSERVVFTVPDAVRSSVEYVCNPHAEMMLGTFVID